MTTAHRPTWKAAVAKANEGGWTAPSSASSVLDIAAHTKLKIRSGAQTVDRRAALRESLLKLEEAEAKADTNRIGRREVRPEIEAESRLKLLKQTADVDEAKVRAKYDDADDDDGGVSDNGGWSDLDNDGKAALADSDDSDLDDSDDDDSDDEDEEAALQAELAKIRSEREVTKAKEQAEADAEEEAQMEEAALIGNPLLAGAGEGSSGKLKRRWNDDVVFRNQAKGESESFKKRFINDTVRNDFHKRFLNKFIK